MKIIPQFDYHKHDFGFGMICMRENESKKYIREGKVIKYVFGIVFLWFGFGIEIELRRKNDSKRDVY